MRFFLLFLLFFVPQAYAGTSPPITKWSVVYDFNPAFTSDTQLGACNLYAEYYRSGGRIVQNIRIQSGGCYFDWGFGVIDNPNSAFTLYSKYACPTGSTSNENPVTQYSVCTDTCSVGTKLVNGVCQQDCSGKSGQKFSVKMNGAVATPARLCDQSCDAACSSDFIVTTQTNGKNYGVLNCTYSGNACTSGQTTSAAVSNPTNATNPPDTPEYNCAKQGKSVGYVNGVAVCVNAGTSGAAQTTQTQTGTQTNTDASGNQTKTDTTTELSTDGQTVTTKETKKDPATGATTTEEKTQTLQTFCEENPNSWMCKHQDDSNFAGDCGAYSCTGDSIQCAMVTKQYEVFCDAIADNEYKNAFVAAQQQAGDSQSSWGLTNVIDIPTDLPNQKILGNSCLTDMVFRVSNQSIVVPFSKLCPYLEFAGSVVKLFSYMVALSIIFRRGS